MTAYEIYKLGQVLNLNRDEFKKLLIEKHIIVPKMMKNELLKSNIGDVGLFFNDEDEKTYKIGRLKSLSGNSNCEDEDGCYYDNFTPMRRSELISAIEHEFFFDKICCPTCGSDNNIEQKTKTKDWCRYCKTEWER
jgi:hypothetical protein